MRPETVIILLSMLLISTMVTSRYLAGEASVSVITFFPVQDAADAEQDHQQADGQGEDASGREGFGRFLGRHP